MLFILIVPNVSYGDTYIGSRHTVDINSGTIDGTTIGATTPSTGVFTTLSATKTFTQHQGTDVASAGAMTLGDGNEFDIT